MWTRTLVISSLLVAWGVVNAEAQNFTQRGARRGAIAGAVVGGLIGGNNDRPALGIVVGGVSGALIGRAIGQQKDQQFYQNQYNPQYYSQPSPYGQGQYYSPGYHQPGYYQPSYPPIQQPSYQPYQQHYQQPSQYNYQPAPIQPIQPPQYNVPFQSPQQAPLIQEPLQAWPHINQPMSLNGNQSSGSSALTQMEVVTAPAVAPGIQTNLSPIGASASSKSTQSREPKSSRANSVLAPAPADSSSPTLGGGAPRGQVLTGEVRSGSVLSGQYHPPTSLSPSQQSQGGGAFIEAPRPTNSNQPYRHGW